MNVGELKEALEYFHDDDEVVVGHPKHDYLQRVMAEVPCIKYKTVANDEVLDDVDEANDHYLSLVDQHLDENGVDPDSIGYNDKLTKLRIPEIEESKPRTIVVIY